MTHLEDLLEADLATAAQTVARDLPDITAALDQLVPRLQKSHDLTAVRRFDFYVDMAAEWLSNLPAHRPEALPPPFFLHQQLRKSTDALLWVIPSADGLGTITVLVDSLRGIAANLPQEFVRPRDDIDEYFFSRFCKALAQARQDMEHSQPLRRAMDTLNLSKSETAGLMGITRQAVDKWLLAGPPADRAPKIGAIAEIADILRYRLRPGLPAKTVRRPADAYQGRTMLDLIANDEHDWLLQSIKDTFDFTRVA